MTVQNSRRQFVIQLGALAAVGSSGMALTGCGGGDDAPEFNYGVASGDPLSDRVILWTHAKYPDSDGMVDLTWEVATDNTFKTVVSRGAAQATSATAFTVKVDATGLSPATEYFYRFRQGSHQSAIGRTRTLPTGTVSEVVLAVFSCANYPAGYFNVYAEAAKSNAQFAIHLGDYIYEYGATNADGSPAYASAQAKSLGRVVEPTSELLTLNDYRRRHAQYKSDPDAKTLHARMPMIAVWDDHEVANDSYKDGAENHDAATEGSFAARKQAAMQAYHEWMPIRTGSDASVIFRSFDFGNLLSLHMLDTRLYGRDKQVTFSELLDPSTAASATATLSSSTRQMMGASQVSWLQGKLAASTATWQVLGQQVLMARMAFPLSILNALNPENTSPEALAAAQAAINAYLTAKATPAASRTPEQQALMSQTKLGYNLDAWDGYPAARETLLMTAYSLGKRLVCLAGDTHNAWHADLTLAGYADSALAGVKVGEEFATSSVSSPGLEEYLSALPPAQIKGIFEGVVDDLHWMDPSRRGFLKMTFTPSAATGAWVFVDSITSHTYSVATPTSDEVRSFSLMG
ncbi:alkaline phosphatase D family protein [Aquabacterium sp.]|uniref:alkaline phosphatase D family protein n=1 Tax=Aquabacterium sp. TaxID=1872578 RepID=UPI003B73334D